jgi:hypothetical protein
MESDSCCDRLEFFAGFNEEPVARLDAELGHLDLEGHAYLLSEASR